MISKDLTNVKNGAWELVKLPPGKHLVTCKWVFKVKHNADGDIRFKAKLVARGFSKAYESIASRHMHPSPSSPPTTLFLRSLRSSSGRSTGTAYLLGRLDEEIYMVQPEGFATSEMKRNLMC